MPTIVSGDFELNDFVLQNEDKIFQSYYPKSVKDILGKYCMMLVPGDLHKKLRTVALTFINTSKTSPNFLHYVHNLTISVMDSWKNSQHISFAKQAKEVIYSFSHSPPLSLEKRFLTQRKDSWLNLIYFFNEYLNLLYRSMRLLNAVYYAYHVKEHAKHRARRSKSYTNARRSYSLYERTCVYSNKPSGLPLQQSS